MDRIKHVNHLGPNALLRGQKVSLRLPRVEELSFIHSLWTDPETMKVLGGIVDYSEEKMRNWFRRMVDPGGWKDCYCLILNEDAKPIGEVSFHNFDSEKRTARLNIKVHASQRGHGYGKDALVTFLAFFFGSVGGQVMNDPAGLDNDLAKRLLLSSRFRIDDSYSDVCMMFITREMYLTRYENPDKSPETSPDSAGNDSSHGVFAQKTGRSESQ